MLVQYSTQQTIYLEPPRAKVTGQNLGSPRTLFYFQQKYSFLKYWKTQYYQRKHCNKHNNILQIKFLSCATMQTISPLCNKTLKLIIIFFKLCLYVYKSFNGHAPQYLTDSLKVKSRPLQGPLTLSASDNTLLVVPPTRTQNGDKAFAVAGPSIWNTILCHIHDSPNTDSFKKVLKKYLFPSQ